MHRKKGWSVLVTDGAGYVGSALVPKLLDRGHRVIPRSVDKDPWRSPIQSVGGRRNGLTMHHIACGLPPTRRTAYAISMGHYQRSLVLLFSTPNLYGECALDSVRGYENLRETKGDIRVPHTVEAALRGCDAVIHLACISDESSFDPGLGKAINFDAFRPIVLAAKKAGVNRFLYVSSFDVYGVKDEPVVTEDSPLVPLTDYAKYKALCETALEEERALGFVAYTVRPATVCGYAPSQRLDGVVNAFADDAVNQGRIRISGGSRKCANIHVDDMADLYLLLLGQPDARIDGKTYNVGGECHTLDELLGIAKRVAGSALTIDVDPADDLRSYHLSSEKLHRELGVEPSRTVEDAIRGLVAAFRSG